MKNISGIYYLINLTNGHSYVGSSKNLGSRMQNYLNTGLLISKQNSNMPITKALLKHGHDKFSVVIIEYADLDLLLDRETFWIVKLNPYYNVLKYGGTSSGYKHSDVTKQMLASLAKNRKHSKETKDLISTSLKGKLNPFYNKTHSLESLSKMTVANSSGVVYVYDSLKQLQVVFPSVKTLSLAINANSSSIKKVIDTGSLFRGGWYVRSSLLSSSDDPVFTSYHLCSELITDIIKNASVKKAIFVFDLNGNYLNKYKGILEAETQLGIRHEKIKKHALSNLPCHCPGIVLAENGIEEYILSYHRLLDNL
jgi:group I intron endonuclease